MGCGQSTNGKKNNNWAKTVNGHNERSSADVVKGTLERYIELEQEIASAEQGAPTMALQNKQKQIEQLEKKIAEQSTIVEEREQATRKEWRDIEELEEAADTQKLFVEQGSWEARKRKEMQEYLDAKNKEEIAKTELKNLNNQKEHLQDEISDVKERSEKLEALYQEQEELLDKIFDGEYGSESENRLENILDQHEQMRNRIVEANFKWRQAQLMVDYAYKQLDHAVSKWNEVSTLSESDLEGRYGIASETRNNLVAAAQNIQGAQRYLSNVQFPYCTPDEVDTLNKATAYIFTDMQTSDRHEHALECYSVTCKRCGALLQWVHQVVSGTIARDLDDINAKVKQSSMDLRRERVKLIQQRVKEVLGKDIDIDIKEMDTDVTVDLNLNDLAKTEGIDPNELTLTPTQLSALYALNATEELAPPPSSEEVFGEKLQQMTDEFLEDQNRLESQLAENQARVTQSLEAKLAARRQRRARKNVEQKEKEAMVKG